MNKLVWQGIVIGLVAGISGLILWPNLAERQVQFVFLDYYRDEAGKRVDVDASRVQKFLTDTEKGIPAFFPGARCEGDVVREKKCVVTARFVTATSLNEVMQNNPDILDDRKTQILPHGVERFLGFLSRHDAKRLSLKLGLDLQGGMRAVFQADYATYTARMQEKLGPVLKELEAQLAKPNLPAEERANAESRARTIKADLELSDQSRQKLLRDALNIIEKRLSHQNLTEPELRIQEGSDSIAVDLPGVANSNQVLNIIKDTVTVEYRLVNDEATARFNTPEFQDILLKIQEIYRRERPDPYEVKALVAEAAKRGGLKPEEGRLFLHWRKNQAGTGISLPREYRVLGPVILDGSDMTNAQENLAPDSAWYRIDFVLSASGAEKFGDLTSKNIGRRLAILWGDRVVSDPVIQGAIVGGQGVVTGQFDLQEARDVANVIREGALPLPLNILSVSFIGPSLGLQSIKTGLYSVVLGFVLVNAFMLLYYRVGGIIAVIALFMNLVILSAVLSLLEFTLTLPGFAGLVLTVGMAVDANVIIFERIREDLRQGKSIDVAVRSGFDASFWTILDANVTTIITAIILYYTGDGPIQGFALTLFYGLVSSMFTALFVSRFCFDLMTEGLKWKSVPLGKGFHFGSR